MEHASGDILWQPRPEEAAATNLARYLEWLARERNLRFSRYDELYAWSIRDLPAFWSSIADFFGVRFQEKPQTVLTGEEMPGAHWFSGATLNYVEHVFQQENSGTALMAETEPRPDGTSSRREISRAELKRQVAAVASFLRSLGVQPGDRVVGYLPNIPETLVAFLAAASLGAVWSVAPAELSSRGVLDRFGQVEPKVLFAVRGYRYGGKLHDRSEPLAEMINGLPTLQHVVLIATDDSPAFAGPVSARALPCTSWKEILQQHEGAALTIAPVPFEHPLWILYSSGTTGIPKAIVHGHGGMLLEQLKALALHFDLRPGDRFLWYTTAGWMMWNMLVSGLLLPGVTVVLYDGSPKFPDFSALWQMVDRLGVTFFGTSAPYLLACMKEGVQPSKLRLQNLRAIGSTGAPLTAEGFRWVYREVKSELLLASVSGGTDVCTAFVLCHPQLPVRAGELQCRGLGAAIEAWDEKGRFVLGQPGELVLTRPFPAMPVFFWNDDTGERFRAAYFEKFPGVWCHGDWIEIDPQDGHCVIHGRSDSTLNRGGVRMGSAEFYAVVEKLPFVAEALVVDLSALNRPDLLVLFVVLCAGHVFDDALRDEIRSRLRSEVSPRHVPDRIYAAPQIPRTLNGKKLEVPVKRILLGHDPARVAQRETLANPAALDYFIDLAKREFSAGV
jgi:acetoacetyl-CoA synthetase